MTAKEIALDAELAETQRQLEQAQREVADLRRQLAESQGEAQRTVYVNANDARDAIGLTQRNCAAANERVASDLSRSGQSVYAVRLTARKVIK